LELHDLELRGKSPAVLLRLLRLEWKGIEH
jgi:hypothetical protein